MQPDRPDTYPYWEHLDNGTVFRCTDYGYQRWDARARTWVRVGVHPGMERDYYIFAVRGGDALRLNRAEIDALHLDSAR